MSARRYYSQEAEDRARREKSILVMVMLSLGMSIGAALALLFAPKSGDELREELTGTVEERFGSLENQLSDLRDDVEKRIKKMA